MKYDEVDFYLIDLKSRFDKIKPNSYYLSYSGGKETRVFTFPQDYIAWHLMAEVFRDFLEPLNLVEKVGESDER